GPVLAPTSIALLMIVWGTLVTQRREGTSVDPILSTQILAGIGIALALYAFMADALHVAPQGVEAVRVVLPTTFNWWGVVVALTLMAAPVAHLAWRMRLDRAR